MNRTVWQWILILWIAALWTIPVYGAQEVRVTYDMKVIKEGTSSTIQEENLRDVNAEEVKMFFHSFGEAPVTKSYLKGSRVEHPQGDVFLRLPNARYDYILKGWMVNGKFYRNSPVEGKSMTYTEDSTLYLVFEKVRLHKVVIEPMKYENGMYSRPGRDEAVLQKDNGEKVFFVYPDSRVTVKDIFLYDARKWREWKMEGSYRAGKKGKGSAFTFIPTSNCIANAVYEPENRKIGIEYFAQKDEGDGRGYRDCTFQMKDMPNKDEVIYGSLLKAPKRPHFQDPLLEQDYQFQGWRIQRGENDYPIYEKGLSNQELRSYHFAEFKPVLCAKFQKIKTYGITFHLDGGKFYNGEKADMELIVKKIRKGEKVAPPYDNSKERGIFREEYRLAGWTENTFSKEPYHFEEPVTRERDLYPIWEPAEPVEIIYEREENIPYEKVKLPYFEQIPTPSSPKKEGYRFQGWKQISPEKTSYEMGKDRAIEPVRYRAQWSMESAAKVRVSFCASRWKNGSYELINPSHIVGFPKDEKMERGEVIELPSLAYLPYEFEGWFLNGTRIEEKNLPVNQDTHFEARFRERQSFHENFEINYSAYAREKNGTYLPVNRESIFYFPSSHQVKKGEGIYLAVPYLPGYEFEGWYEGEKMVKSPLIIEESKHLTARFVKVEKAVPNWKKEMVKIIYHAQEGSFYRGEKVKVQVLDGSAPFVFLDEIPQKEGEIFTGWYCHGNKMTEEKIQRLILEGHREISFLAQYQKVVDSPGEEGFLEGDIPSVTIHWQTLPSPQRKEKNTILKIPKEEKIIFRIGEGKYWKQEEGREILFEIDGIPYIKEDRTMVPMRYAAEAFGIEVSWHEQGKKVIFEKEGKAAALEWKKGKVTVDAEVQKLDPTLEIRNDRLYIPLRTMVELLEKLEKDKEVEYGISWNRALKEVVIIKRELLSKTIG